MPWPTPLPAAGERFKAASRPTIEHPNGGRQGLPQADLPERGPWKPGAKMNDHNLAHRVASERGAHVQGTTNPWGSMPPDVCIVPSAVVVLKTSD